MGNEFSLKTKWSKGTGIGVCPLQAALLPRCSGAVRHFYSEVALVSQLKRNEMRFQLKEQAGSC